LRYGLVFRNHGPEAGQSLKYPHSQLISTTVVPHKVAVELDWAHQYREVNGRCLMCDITEQETQEGRRIVTENSSYVCFAPYAAWSPFELMLTSRRHVHAFEALLDDELESLVELLKDVLQRLKRALRGPPYNLVLHTASYAYWQPGRSRSTIENAYHFHIDIVPQRLRVGGFEIGVASTSTRWHQRQRRDPCGDRTWTDHAGSSS